MTHRREIEYWASHPDHTKVWSRAVTGETQWWRDDNPVWQSAGHIFIVDDEWAALRKANADGKIVQVTLDGVNWQDEKPDWWKTDFYIAVRENMRPGDFRIKPEWYEDIPPEGVICWVWNQCDKKLRVVKDYIPGGVEPFVAVRDGQLDGQATFCWANAEPVKPSECYGGEKCNG